MNFYHGTRTPIHILSNTRLEPNCALIDLATNRGYDINDPYGPHVFVTRRIHFARLFSVKSQDHLAISSWGRKGAVIVYTRKPDSLDETGYVYTIDQADYAPFQPMFFQLGNHKGKPTGNFVTRERLDVSKHEPILVRGLRELMLRDNALVFYMSDVGKPLFERITTAVASAGDSGQAVLMGYLSYEVTEGRLHCLNTELDETDILVRPKDCA